VSVVDAARRLLGMRLRTGAGPTLTEVELTEVEAYGAADDPASHAHRGLTTRNRAMFGPPGTLYVYRSYGIHWCANISVGPEGQAGAVLLRGGRVTQGRQLVVVRRGRHDHLTDGPGKLCQALAITGDHDGTSVLSGPVRLLPAARVIAAEEIEATPRIGISRATERAWRFVLARGSTSAG
jgi:DNA-3-methyladenine glycosylase